MTTETHVHEVDKRNRALMTGWCVCGETWDEGRQRWLPPKYFDGMRRRFAWDARDARDDERG